MADKTFGVKVSEDLYDKVKEMIENSGDSAKDWFEKAVSIAEMQSVKEGAKDYNQDLSELEIHTARIYELVSNMIQRSIYIKDHAVKEVSEKLEQTEAVIGEYQEKTKLALEEAKQAKEENKILEQEKKDLFKQVEDSRSTLKTNQLLIDEYKQKNDTLNGLVAKYQDYADENEQLKEGFSQEREQLQSQIKELNMTINDLKDENKDLNLQIETLNERHAIEVERLTEKKEYEKNRALLELEKEYQQRILSLNEKYNEKINGMYQQISDIQTEYEEKLEEWKQDFIKKTNGSEKDNKQ